MRTPKYIVGMDYESYYDKDYSLSKMPTHQYIRDPRWKCLGCGFQFGNEPAFYVEDPEPVLARIDWENTAVVCHNATFDGSVLWERYGKRKPAMWLDTQLIARWAIAQGHLPPDMMVGLAKLAPLVGMSKGDTWSAVHGGGQSLADYGTDDVIIMMKLLGLLMGFRPPPEELEYMDMHIRMATEPRLEIDRELLEPATVLSERDAQLNALLRKEQNMLKLLKGMGVEPEYKTTPAGKRKAALAKTDKFMQELLLSGNEMVAELAYRRLNANSSITRTRARTLLNVGTPLPSPLLYYGAGTGRASGKDGYNMQNNPKKGPLRQAIRAAAGQKLVVGDSSQVEVRTVGWRAGEERLLELFEYSDPYRTFGGRYMYSCGPDELDDHQRSIAKAGVLGLGFGQGWRGLIKGSREKAGLIIPEASAKLATNTYRTSFARIPQWWKTLMRMVRQEGELILPSGRKLIYPSLGYEMWSEEDSQEELIFHRPAIFSKGVKYGAQQRVRMWHGLACLALDTLVLTRAGWVPLADVGRAPVWDGAEWVTHDGLTPTRIKNTIRRNGVKLTNDHRVLTDAGWKLAEESEGYERGDAWLAHRRNLRRFGRAAQSMGVPLPLRSLTGMSGPTTEKRRCSSLRIGGMFTRLPFTGLHGAGGYARHESAPRLSCMAGSGSALHPRQSSRLGELWRAGRDGVRRVAGFFPRVLAGHGEQLRTGADDRACGQQFRILRAELPVGYAAPAKSQPANKPDHPHALGGHNSGGSERAQRGKNVNAALPAGGRLAAGRMVQEPVADLANCGPRHRFVVCAPGSVPFYAHNCENDTQAVARDVVFWQTARMRDAGLPIVGMSHDESITVVNDNEVEDAKECMRHWLSQTPDWAEGLPVKGEVNSGQTYAEAK